MSARSRGRSVQGAVFRPSAASSTQPSTATSRSPASSRASKPSTHRSSRPPPSSVSSLSENDINYYNDNIPQSAPPAVDRSSGGGSRQSGGVDMAAVMGSTLQSNGTLRSRSTCEVKCTVRPVSGEVDGIPILEHGKFLELKEDFCREHKLKSLTVDEAAEVLQQKIRELGGPGPGGQMFRQLKFRPNRKVQIPEMKKKHFKKGLQNLNIVMDDDQLDQLWAMTDKDGNGIVDYYEFLGAFESDQLRSPPKLYDTSLGHRYGTLGIKYVPPPSFPQINTGRVGTPQATGLDWKHSTASTTMAPNRLTYQTKKEACQAEFCQEWPSASGVEKAPAFGAAGTGGRFGLRPNSDTFGSFQPDPERCPHMTGVRSDQIGTTNKHGVIKGQGFAQADLRVNRYVARGARKLASEADVLSRIVERQVHGQQMKLKRMENVFNRRTVVLNEQHYRPENIRSWDAA